MKAKTKTVKIKAKPAAVKSKVVATQKVVTKSPAKKVVTQTKVAAKRETAPAKSALLMKKKVQTAEGLKRTKMKELKSKG